MKYIYSDIIRKIIGCAMKAHIKLDCGFQQVICQRALEMEFPKNQIAYVRSEKKPYQFIMMEKK